MIRGVWRRVDDAGGGRWLDLGLYSLGAAFAGLTAATSTLAPHRAWGAIAVFGYAAAAVATAVHLRFFPGTGIRPLAVRAAVTGFAWLSTTLLPLVVQAAQRVAGRSDRAQEEVLVVEHGGQRLLDSGTPYLARDDIAALPPDQWLLGYLPYQPGMALFGLPRALAGTAWWTDARVWFAVATAVVLAVAATTLLRSSPPRLAPGAANVGAPVLRGLQAATVLPVCALTLATGGDDLPVLALCLLALALCARDRYGAAGIAAGLGGALKLFAWPVTLVLLVLALAYRRPAPVRPAVSPDGGAPDGGAPDGPSRGRPDPEGGAPDGPSRDGPDPDGGKLSRYARLGRFAAGAIGLPVLALLPAAAIDADALLDNVVRFPLGDGLVTSPAQSPFPGYLIAEHAPAGRAVATGLLLLAGLVIAGWLLRRPPRTATAAGAVCALGLLAAILLMPSTRFGYLLYPAALAVWLPALAAPAAHPPPSGPATHPPLTAQAADPPSTTRPAAEQPPAGPAIDPVRPR